MLAEGKDDGDQNSHPIADERPEGLGPGMDRYLRRGMPEKNTKMHEVETGKAIKVEALPIPPNKL